MKVKSESEVAQLCPTLCDPMDCSLPGPPSMGFSRQEYWSGVPLPSPMINLDSILKSRDITLPTKICLVKAMVFPGVMYGYESWTMKKAEHPRINAFELWCWKRLLSSFDSKEIKPINPKENQSWIFIERTDAEAPILWPPDAKN